MSASFKLLLGKHRTSGPHTHSRQPLTRTRMISWQEVVKLNHCLEASESESGTGPGYKCLIKLPVCRLRLRLTPCNGTGSHGTASTGRTGYLACHGTPAGCQH
eukprot:2970233-Rhodomonas_salina.1